MGKSAPKAPDPYKVADAQGAQNKEFAEYNASLNRINQTSPFGSVSYTQNGTDPKTGAPIYTQSTTLDPKLQGLLDSQISSQGKISDSISGAIDRLPTDPFNFDTDVSDVRQRSFDSQMALMAPKFDQGWKELEGTMSDRGIPIGAEIWNDQTGNFQRARDTSILGAARQADQDASNEFQRQYGNAMNEYNLPLQQLATLMGTSQPVSNPTFSPFATSSASAPDLQGGVWNAYQSDVDRYNQQQSNMMGGLLGLGKLGLGAYSAGLFG